MEAKNDNKNSEKLYFSKEAKIGDSNIEKVYFSNAESTENEKWNEIDLILDTGCGSTICGEL